jgi:hypothetical protein
MSSAVYNESLSGSFVLNNYHVILEVKVDPKVFWIQIYLPELASLIRNLLP